MKEKMPGPAQSTWPAKESHDTLDWWQACMSIPVFYICSLWRSILQRGNYVIHMLQWPQMPTQTYIMKWMKFPAYTFMIHMPTCSMYDINMASVTTLANTYQCHSPFDDGSISLSLAIYSGAVRKQAHQYLEFDRNWLIERALIQAETGARCYMYSLGCVNYHTWRSHICYLHALGTLFISPISSLTWIWRALLCYLEFKGTPSYRQDHLMDE